MSEITSRTVFIYSEKSKSNLDLIVDNPYGVEVIPVTIDEFRKRHAELLEEHSHFTVSAELTAVKEVMLFAANQEVTIGFLPAPEERKLSRCYNIPSSSQKALELALRSDGSPLDLVLCNEHLLLFQGALGQLPLFDVPLGMNRFEVFWDSLKKVASLKLFPFSIEKFGNQRAVLNTAASGCVILSSQEKGLTSSIIDHDSTNDDGMVALLAVAPFSITDYLKLMWVRLVYQSRTGQIPPSVGYIKCPEIKVNCEDALPLTVDGEEHRESSVHLRVLPGAVKVNIGEEKRKEKFSPASNKEKYNIKALPVGKEVQKAANKRVPFFAYASEERFKDLFIALREDARINSTYIVLMVLSTALATVGLYLNSASVIIGAMLLAPLMAPIISCAMSLVRYDRKLFYQSLRKIGVGIVIALIASSFWAVISPYQPMTTEMQGRLNPSLLDLLVAVAAGIAGAYAKSYKEVLESLAGVAIAVALVPPLAVAGIGLGRVDPIFFGNAFLLFLTNLIGIVLAATFTFRMLGFSPLLRDRKTITLFFISFCIITVPLSLAYNDIVYRAELEKRWEKERFLVNGKYLIIKDARFNAFSKHKVLTVNIHARDQISRIDLKELKRKIEKNFKEELVIRANVTFIP